MKKEEVKPMPVVKHPLNKYWENKRREAGLTLKDIADGISMTKVSVYRYLTGENSPNEETVKKLCDLLNADYEEGKKEFIKQYYQYRNTEGSEYFVRSQLERPNKYKNRPNPPPGKFPRAYKDTFWNRLRISRKLTGAKMAKDLDVNAPSLYLWLNGAKMPPEKWIKAICEYFDVPLEQGRQEFENAHSTWLSSKYNRVFCYSANEDVAQKTWVFDSEDKILESLYGKIDFDVFSEFELKFRQRLYKEAFSALYGKLDFDTYYQIQASIADMQKTK